MGLKPMVTLQKKTLIIMNFKSRDSHSSPSLKSNHIKKVEDKILIGNILYINKSLNNLPLIINSCFTFCSDIQNYQSHLLAIKYLNNHIELILAEKNQSL